jgi:hypothetical protein
MGMMNLQLVIVLLIVATAVAFFVRRLVKQVQGKKQGCDKCGPEGH